MKYSKNSAAEIIVLLAHYNDTERLKKAVLSIKEPIPVDLLIIDDGSSLKPNESELKSLYNGGNLTLVLLEKNMGSEIARNHGLKIISELNYKYIGAMDSDDLNKEKRFYKQFQYLEQNDSVKLLGAWCDCIDNEGNFLYTQKYPTSYKEIRKKMYINSMFAHATLLFRSDILKTIGFYPEKNKWAEDYAFAFNACRKFQVENYPEALIFYTINENGISSMHRKGQVLSRIRIIKEHFYFGFYPIYGLIRNLPLLFFSREFMSKIKQILRKIG
jgi:GT2 family glycosyltransferase